VVNRTPLPLCGAEEVGLEGTYDAEARACLLAAHLDGRGAELLTTQNTMEGDPINRYVRVHENGVVEIFVDATRDRFGSGEWERLVCQRLAPIAEVNEPPDLVFPADMVFVEEGCEELPTP
jgi:hypothetical protein